MPIKTTKKKAKTDKKNSKKTEQDYRNEMALKDYISYKAIWLTKAFRQFCQANLGKGKENLEARLQVISQKPETEREDYEKMWLEWSFEEALDETLRRAFLDTFKGKQVLKHLKVLEMVESPISYDKNLFDDKILIMRINLTFPKERIKARFKHILDEMHPQVERPPTPPRSWEKMSEDDIDDMFRAYELVEKYQNIKKATEKFYTKARAARIKEEPATDKRYRQVRELHKKVKSIIGDL